MRTNLINQFKSLLPTLLVMYIPILILLVLAGAQNKVPISYLTQDPTVVAKVPAYIGFFSNIGVLFWCATTAICLFTYAVLRENSNTSQSTLFFLFAGLINLILLFDDLFLGHEYLFPRFLRMPEEVVFAGYALVILLFLIKFWKFILKTEFLALFLAFGFFGLSIFVDILPEHLLPNHHIFEDGSKLLGGIGWFIYFVRTSFIRIKAP